MVLIKSLIALVACTSTLVSGLPTLFGKSYRNQKVYRFNVTSDEQAAVLQNLVETLDLDNWSHGYKGLVDIRVADADVASLKTKLFDVIPSSVFIPDIQANIDVERLHLQKNSFALEAAIKANPSAFAELAAPAIFNDYQSTATYATFLAGLPGVTQFTLGTTFLGSSIPGFKFGTGPSPSEWISPAVTTYLANYLATDPAAATLRSKFTFHVIPVLNVDGYAYTRSNDRLWRKNRQPNTGSTCSAQIPTVTLVSDGSSPEPPAANVPTLTMVPLPSPRTKPKAISQLHHVSGNVVSYIDFHAYSQLWMFPNGYSCTVKAGGDQAVAALKANGDVCNTIYQASGSSVDWVYNTAKVTYTYTVELRDTGTYGFQLPASQIVPSGLETQAGVVTLWNYVAAQLQL
ncbi:hypothetical protein BC829DRAFT_398232 [Chytridium lagenaria]|nr:hypothetical protein BC829DRAFT_398232 [Chytridium lagenaria]